MVYLIIISIFCSFATVYSDSCISGDCINGKGVKVFSNGDKYEGTFKDKKFQGKGTFTSLKKNKEGIVIFQKVYEGLWKDNKIAGKGKLTIQKNGKSKKSEGDFLNGKLNGHGVLETDSATYKGRFIKNRLNGQGEFNSKKGEKYVGEFLDHKFDGLGTYTFKDGSIYIGNFKKGKFHGRGRIFNKNNKLIKSGNWENGQFIISKKSKR